MPIDPSIPLQVQTPTFDLASAFGKAQAFRNAQTQNQLQQAELEQMPLKNQLLQQQVTGAETENQLNKMKAAATHLDMLTNYFSGTNESNYAQKREAAISMGLDTPQNIPEDWNSGGREYTQNALSTMSAHKQQLDLQTQQADIALKQAHAKFFETGMQGGSTGMLMNKLMASNPNMTPEDALAFIKGGANQGIMYQGGQANPYQGYNEVLAQKKGAEKTGEASGTQTGEAEKTYTVMSSNLPTVIQRFKEMKDAADNASSGLGVNEQGTGIAQQIAKSAIGDDETSKANALLQQRAAQGILPELGPQLAQAGVRGNKFLETIANSASGLDLAAKPEDKKALIQGLEDTYINNLKSTAAQLRAKGQNVPSDKDIDNLVNQIRKGNVPQELPNPIQNEKISSSSETLNSQNTPIAMAQQQARRSGQLIKVGTNKKTGNAVYLTPDGRYVEK